MQPPTTIYSSGETAATIAFEAVIDRDVNLQVQALYHHIAVLQIAGFIDFIPSYHTLTIIYEVAFFKKTGTAFDEVKRIINDAIATCNWQQEIPGRTIEIPVCYHPSLGSDIEELAITKGIEIAEVIRLHTSVLYHVFAIGFLPGFAYMGTVDERIAMPRKAQPRANVIKGSVGIAGEQTGIYPLNSPGGWNIIGQTPLPLFEAVKELPALLQPGDTVRFREVSLDEFYVLKSLLAKAVKARQLPAKGIEVIKQGIADTIQDLGRFGYQHFGINPSGAMDIVVAQVANFLAGNEANEAVIEVHFPASVFCFQTDAVIALAGADFDAAIDGKTVAVNKPLLVAKGAKLEFRKNISGARCYIAVKGGLDIKPWLNSSSTNVKAGIGGHQGRLIKMSDTIGLKAAMDMRTFLNQKSLVRLPWAASVNAFYTGDDIIRCIAGYECLLLTEASREVLKFSYFEITAQSDRMGYRLNGLPLLLQQPLSLISTAVVKGTVQLLPNGQLIVLMADHQTMGGYPRVAHVIQADIPKLAQMRPHQRLRFQFITQREAENILMDQYRNLLQLKNACTFRLQAYLQT